MGKKTTKIYLSILAMASIMSPWISHAKCIKDRSVRQAMYDTRNWPSSVPGCVSVDRYYAYGSNVNPSVSLPYITNFMQDCKNSSGTTIANFTTRLYYHDGIVDASCTGLPLVGSAVPSTYMPFDLANIAPPAITDSRTPVKSALQCSSIIQVDNQAIGHTVPLVGTPYELVYFSDRVRGRGEAYRLYLPVTGDSGVGVNNVELHVNVAGILYDNYAPFDVNLTDLYVWNGLDVMGGIQEGSVLAQVDIVYNYDGGSFNMDTRYVPVGGYQARALGLGGWTISARHFYDKNTGNIFTGDGNSRKVTALTYGTGYLVSSEDGSEAYIFSSSGKHLSTRDALTGATKLTFAYLSDGRISSITDAFSNSTVVTYPTATSVLITSPYGKVTTLTLTSGWTTKIRNPKSEDYNMTYSGTGGLLATFTKPNGHVSTMTYDADGLLTKEEGSGGAFRNFASSGNSASRTTATSTAAGSNETFVTGHAGTQYSRAHTNPAGLVTNTVDYTSGSKSASYPTGLSESLIAANDIRFGAMSPFPQTTLTSLASPATSLQMNGTQSAVVSGGDPLNVTSFNQTFTRADRSDIVYSRSYTGSTRQLVLTSPMSRTQTTIFNVDGTVASSANSGITSTAFTYDTSGRVSTATQGARVTSFTYDSDGNLASVTDPLSRTTQFGYDLNGRVTSVTRPDLQVVAYTYDGDGNVLTVTPPARSAHTFLRNTLEQVSSYQPPMLASVSTNTAYSYNLDKELTLITRPDTKTITHNYHATKRQLLSRVGTGSKNEYTYSATTGLRLTEKYTATSPADVVTTTNTYSGENLATQNFLVKRSSTTYLNKTVQFARDSHFELTGINLTSDTGAVAASQPIGYDKDGLVTSFGSLSITRDVSTGLPSSTSLGSVTQALTYNSFGEYLTDNYLYSTTPLLATTLVRDNGGRISQRTENLLGGSANFYEYVYDSVGRLVDTKLAGVVIRHYVYDANGNRTGYTSSSGTVTGVIDSQDRLSSYGSNIYTYSKNGEIATKTNGSAVTTYTYNVFGGLTKVALPGSVNVEYFVDAQQRRVGRMVGGTATNFYIYQSGQQILAEYNGSGVLQKRFVYASKVNVPDFMITSAGTVRIISDHVGSPRLVVNVSTGAVAQQITYDDFGKVLSDTAPGFTPFGFAGGLYDSSTGLLRFGARDYDPETGRWLAKDPIGFGGGDTNLYGYVINDPVNFIDPSGEVALPVAVAIGAVVGGVANVIGSVLSNSPVTLSGVLGGAAGGAASVVLAGPAIIAAAAGGAAAINAANIGFQFAIVRTAFGTLFGTIFSAGADALFGVTDAFASTNPCP